MGFIGDLFELAFLLVVVVVGITLVIIPIKYDLQFYEENGDYPLCHGYAIAQAVGLFACWGEYSAKAYGKLFLAICYTIIITIIAVRRVSDRIRMLGFDDEDEKKKAIFCQIVAPLSIVVVLFIITGLIDSLNKKFNKKK